MQDLPRNKINISFYLSTMTGRKSRNHRQKMMGRSEITIYNNSSHDLEITVLGHRVSSDIRSVIKNKVWKICSSIIHAEWKTEYTRENETEPVDGRHMFYKGGVKSYSNELFSIHRILIYYPQSDTHIREGLLYSNSVWTKN